MPASSAAASEGDLKLFLGLSNQDKVGRDDDDDQEDDEDDYDDDEQDEQQSEGGSDDDEGDEAEEVEEGDDDGFEDDERGGDAQSYTAKGAGDELLTDAEIQFKKTTILCELERLRGLGCRLTRTYTMEDDLHTMEYEVKAHTLHLEQQNSINALKDGLRLFASSCEFANTRYGPFLNLTNWGGSVSSDLDRGKYNLTLSKLSRKYFKTSQSSNPEMELAFGLLSSAAFHHFQRSHLGRVVPGGGNGLPRAPPSRFPPAAEEDDEVPPTF